MSFGFAPRAANAYAQVGLETGVSTADPHKLVLMLFEGALLSIAKASAALDSQDIPGKGMAISKAIEIILNGLKVSLDYEAGGDLAEKLGALYDYMTSRLLYANLHSSRPALDEVAGLLRDIKGAWESIGTTV
jgi:flagellar protein FliS